MLTCVRSARRPHHLQAPPCHNKSSTNKSNTNKSNTNKSSTSSKLVIKLHIKLVMESRIKLVIKSLTT